MEESTGKRGWNSNFHGGLGKRRWNSNFSGGLGKRAWNSNFSGGLGKRAWNKNFSGINNKQRHFESSRQRVFWYIYFLVHFQTFVLIIHYFVWNEGGFGKRAWNSNFSGGLGKRAWNSGFSENWTEQWTINKLMELLLLQDFRKTRSGNLKFSHTLLSVMWLFDYITTHRKLWPRTDSFKIVILDYWQQDLSCELFSYLQ